MAAFTIDQLLGYVYLTGLIEAIKTGIPNVLPPEFLKLRQDTLKDQGRYTRVQGTRRTARRIEYGAATRRRELRNVGTYDVKLLTLGEHIALDIQTYMSLRAYDSYQVQNLGMQEIERQALQFRTLFDNTELAMLYSTLANMNIWFDAGGNLLPTSSGAALTVNFGADPNHQNQLNGLLTLGWQNASADIPTMILNIKDQALFDTGYELEYVFYGSSIPSFFANNALMVEYLARFAGFRDHFLQTNEIPDGLFGLKWRRVSAAFFDSTTAPNPDPLGAYGTQTISKFFPASMCVFTPAIERTWFEWVDGQLPCPTTFNPFSTIQGAVGSFDIKQRMASWAVPIMNPISAELHYELCTLPVVKFPDALFQAVTMF